MKPFFLSLWVWCAAAAMALAQPPPSPAPGANAPALPTSAASPLAAADALRAAQNFASAREAYANLLLEAELSPADRTLAEIRFNDAAWRALAAAGRRRDQEEELARIREALRALQEDLAELPGDLPPAWAEATLSLAESHFDERLDPDVTLGTALFRAVLDWHAQQPAGKAARLAYLASLEQILRLDGWPAQRFLVGLSERELADILSLDPPATIGLDIAVALAERRTDSAASPGQLRQAIVAWRDAIARSRGTSHTAQLLLQLGELLENRGQAQWGDNGELVVAPDLAEALATYRSILEQFSQDAEAVQRAQAAIDRITQPSLEVFNYHTFLPGATQQVIVASRNLAEVTVEFVPLQSVGDFAAASEFPATNATGREGPLLWLAANPALSQRPAVRTVPLRPQPTQRHLPVSQTVSLDPPLPPGAYLVRARQGELLALDTLFVTDLAVVTLPGTEGRLAAWAVDAETGEPAANATAVLLTQWSYWSNHQRVSSFARRTFSLDGDGFGSISDVPESGGRPPGAPVHWIVAQVGNRWAVSRAAGAGVAADREQAEPGSSQEDWPTTAIVHTDRPAYRPGETVHFRVVVRQLDPAGRYRRPTVERVGYMIGDSEGETVATGTFALTDMGTGTFSWVPPANARLGGYGVLITGLNAAGEPDLMLEFNGDFDRALFSIEEYRLPEFSVALELPKSDDGQPRICRAGEEVEVTVVARTYFGAPVADAKVELSASLRRAHFGVPPPPRPFPWMARADRDRPHFRHDGYMGNDRSTVLAGRTDAQGRAVFRWQAPTDEADWEYAVRATVTDAANREMTGNGTVRIAQQGHYAALTTPLRLYRPGEPVALEVRTVDANTAPVRVAGQVRLVRMRWQERFRGPSGEVLSAADLDARSAPSLPRQNRLDRTLWQPIEGRYVEEPVGTAGIATGADGTGQWTARPATIGFYKAYWLSRDETNRPIRAEAEFYVGEANMTDFGWRPGGVTLVVPSDYQRTPGEPLPVLVVTDRAGQAVLFRRFSRAGTELQVLRPSGNSALLSLPVSDADAPQLFLYALAVHDLAVHRAQAVVTVPPSAALLNVVVEPLSPTPALPGSPVEARLRVTDYRGQPVPNAEVALGVVDESLYALFPETSRSLMAVLYGDSIYDNFGPSSSFDDKRYLTPAQMADLLAELREQQEAKMAAARAEDEEVIELGSFGVTAIESRGYQATGSMAGSRLAAPPPSAAPMARERMVEGGALDAAAPPPVDRPAIAVRSDFRTTAHWAPTVRTGADGTATVTFAYPDNTTSWRWTARAVTAQTEVGEATATTATRVPLTVRLQTPRFLTVGDAAVVTALLDNTTEAPLATTVTLAVAEGVALTDAAAATQTITVPAGGSASVTFPVRAEAVGTARFTVEAATASAAVPGDAQQRTLPVQARVAPRQLFVAGRVESLAGAATSLRFDLPEGRVTGSATASLALSPGYLGAMLDALPYLVHFPYGCTEQTLSRFVPAVLVAQTLREQGWEAAAIARRLSRDPALPADRTGAGLGQLDEVIATGLRKLAATQRADGAWPWFEGGPADLWMTTYALWALRLAADAGVDLAAAKVDVAAAQAWLQGQLAQQTDLPRPTRAWVLFALAHRATGDQPARATEAESAALLDLLAERGQLEPYARALLAVACQRFGLADDARQLLRNLADDAHREDAAGTSIIAPTSSSTSAGALDEASTTAAAAGDGSTTATATPAPMASSAYASWGRSTGWRRWWDGGNEATAATLYAFAAIDAGHPLAEAAAAWLARARRADRWENTRDSAWALLALNAWTQATTAGQATAAEVPLGVAVNGTAVGTVPVSVAALQRGEIRLALPPELLRTGDNVVTLTPPADSVYPLPILAGLTIAFDDASAEIAASGNEIFVERRWFRVQQVPTLLRGWREVVTAWQPGSALAPGDELEVVVVAEAKTDLEYLAFEDFKAATLAAIEVASGGTYLRQVRPEFVQAVLDRTALPDRSAPYAGGTVWAYREWRDNRVVTLVGDLPQGFWEMRYRLRLETPGAFTALPAQAHAFYVPEVRGNSTSQQLEVAPATAP